MTSHSLTKHTCCMRRQRAQALEQRQERSGSELVYLASGCLALVSGRQPCMRRHAWQPGRWGGHRDGSPATKPVRRLPCEPWSALPASCWGSAPPGLRSSPALKPSSDRSCRAIKFLRATPPCASALLRACTGCEPWNSLLTTNCPSAHTTVLLPRHSYQSLAHDSSLRRVERC